jgi:UDP-N-acetylglucosamine acyltransferase
VSTTVHPTAIIDPSACLGEDVEIGPWVMVGPEVTVGDRCRLGPRSRLVQNVVLAADVTVGDGSILGGDPQDLKFKGEKTWVEIGAGTIIREYTTINRATSHSYRTTVGERCFIMTYVHLAHDCHLGNGVIISNATQLAGHVTVEDHAIISGLVAVHQFVNVGAYSFIGGCSRVPQDVPPYLKAVGNPIKLYGLNSVGLQRNNFDPGVIRELKRAYRLFFRSDLNVSQALERAHQELEMCTEVRHFLAFVDNSGRGVVR